MNKGWGYGSYSAHYGCSSKCKQCSDGKECKETNCDDKNKECKDGCFCRKCKTFYPMAEPDDKDGKILCWGCKNLK